MEILIAVAIGLLVGGGVYLLLRARSFSVVLGLTLLSYATNLLLFASGGLNTNQAPLISEGGPFADPLPQALVLTAIVIGFAMTAFILVLALRALDDLGSDRVDARSGREER
jgi:multicomponent K+:H+ antiporter subunit C